MSNKFNYDAIFSKKSSDNPINIVSHAKYDFAVAYPAPETLPMDGLIQSLTTAMDTNSEKVSNEMAYYPHILGSVELREFTSQKLRDERGFIVDKDQIVLTNGSGEAIGLVIQALTNPGDIVLAEEFVYMGTLNQFRKFGAEVVGIKIDDKGIIPNLLDKQISDMITSGRKPKYLYTIPEHQNPTGSSLPKSRREEILKIAHKYNLPILEDDCYVDLRYESVPEPAFRALDDSGIVIYVASFSKLLAPGLRLGYFTGPDELIRRSLDFRVGSGPNQFAALAIDGYLRNNQESHKNNFNPLLKEKYQSMNKSLVDNFSKFGAEWSNPEGGCYIWLKMPEGCDISSVRDKVFSDGVGYIAGTNFEADASGRIGHNYARLCFAFESPEKNREGIKLLADLFKKYRVVD